MRRINTHSTGQIRPPCPKAMRRFPVGDSVIRRVRIHGRQPSGVRVEQVASQKKTDQVRAFEALTYPFINAIHAHALCLSGSKDVAVELVIATYTAAFLDYEKLRSIPALGARCEQDTLAWLYRHMHSIYCDTLIAQAHCASPVSGGQK